VAGWLLMPGPVVREIQSHMSTTRLPIRSPTRQGERCRSRGSPLSYSVEVFAGDDGQDLDPAAAGLSPSRQWVLAALQAGGAMQTVKQLGDGWPRPAGRSSPLPSRPPSASWRRLGRSEGARKVTAGPATGRPRSPTATATQTVMVGERPRDWLGRYYLDRRASTAAPGGPAQRGRPGSHPRTSRTSTTSAAAFATTSRKWLTVGSTTAWRRSKGNRIATVAARR
jgi:hypothetical protein